MSENIQRETYPRIALKASASVRTNTSLSIAESLQTDVHCITFDTIRRYFSVLFHPSFVSLGDARFLTCEDWLRKMDSERRGFPRGKSGNVATTSMPSIPFLMTQIRRKNRPNKSEENGWNTGDVGSGTISFILAEGYTPLACSKPLESPLGSFCVGSVPDWCTLPIPRYVVATFNS